MLASVWHWPSLQYKYFLLPSRPLDAGGWEEQRGLSAKSVGGDGVVAFESVVESLPDEAIFAGLGDECVGELFVMRDDHPRQEADLEMLGNSTTPEHRKIISLLRDNTSTLRHNESGEEQGRSKKEYKQNTTLLWETLLPVFAGVGAGIAILRYAENLSVKSALLAWLGGAAIGMSLGLEVAKNKFIKGEDL